MQARLCDTTQMKRFEQSIHRFEMVLQGGWILVGRFEDIFDGDVMRSLRCDERPWRPSRLLGLQDFSCLRFVCCFISVIICSVRIVAREIVHSSGNRVYRES